MIFMHIRNCKPFTHLSPYNLSIRSQLLSLSVTVHFFSTSIETKDPQPQQPLTLSELLQKYQFSPDAASLLVSPPKDPAKSDTILSFLKQIGFSSAQLEKMVMARPQLLSASLENSIKPKFEILENLGLSADEVAEVVSKEPAILCSSVNNRVVPSLLLLKDLLGPSWEPFNVLRRCGKFLVKDLGKDMLPNFEFLRNHLNFSVPEEYILHYLCTYPRRFLQKPDTFRKCVFQVDKMGVDRSSKMYLQAFRVVASLTAERWELRLLAFRDMGFSESDIVTLFRKVPSVFSRKPEKIKRIKEILLATGKYDMSCLLNIPVILAYSEENRIVPRLRVLETLEKSNLIKKWPGLRVFQMTDARFFEKFVEPNSDVVGQIYVAENAISRTRRRKVMTTT